MVSRTRRALRATGRAIAWPFRMLGRAVAYSARFIADLIGELIDAVIP
jgi:hypothetical protein